VTAWRSNLPSGKAALRRADRAGVQAAITIPFNQVRERLSGSKGYTSGDFSQGVDGSASLLAKTDPEQIVGGHIARFGMQAMKAGLPPYPLFWEIGHRNVFMTPPGDRGDKNKWTFVRVPIFVPAMHENAERMADAYRATFARVLSGAAPPPTDPDPTREVA